MAELKVYNGTSWLPAIAKVWNGSSWVGDKHFYDGTAWIPLGVDRSDEIRFITHSFIGSSIFNSKVDAVATGAILFKSNGDVIEFTTDFGSPSPAVGSIEWHRDNISAGLGDDWEVKATLTSGSTPNINAGLGTWLRINVDRVWGNTRIAAVGTTTSTLTLDFGLYGTSTALVTITGIITRAIITA